MKLNFYKDEWDDFIDNCGFTDVELEMVVYIRRGWACADIAEELHLSHSTAKKKRSQIGKKITRYLGKKTV